MNTGGIGNKFRDIGEGFNVNVTLNVNDADALWQMAAQRALASPIGLTLADVEDTIGPREAPSIADCIALLLSPADLAGCTLMRFEIEEGDSDDGNYEAACGEMPLRAFAGIGHH